MLLVSCIEQEYIVVYFYFAFIECIYWIKDTSKDVVEWDLLLSRWTIHLCWHI